MIERKHIRLNTHGQLPTMIYLDQISSIVSLGILGTKIVLKEVDHGQNVQYVFSINFDVIEEQIQRAEQRSVSAGW